MLEARSGTKFLTNSANPTLWTLFGSHKELGGVSIQKMQVEDPPKSLNQKEKAQWSTSWARLPETNISTKSIIPQNLSVIPNNRVMSMEQLFQDISINKCWKLPIP